LADALVLSSRLCALSVVLQTLELLWLRRAFSARGVLGAEGVSLVGLLAFQLGLALLLLALGASPLFLGLFVSHLLLITRLGAPFNGGSDAMTGLALLLLGVAACDPWQSVIMHGALIYLAMQTVFSYFVAGVAKLKERGWRTGSALVHFASLPKYGVPKAVRALLARPGSAGVASWSILLFECSFPLALLGPRVCLVYVSFGAAFHAANAALFGLNRFFFSWLAVYPVLVAVSGFVPWARG
jgi:hypothetical protein